MIKGYLRLCLFFLLFKSKAPDYLFQEIPEQRNVEYNLKCTCYYEPNISRTKRYSNSCFYNTLYEWNQLDRAVKNSPSIAVFKSNLLQMIRPVKSPIYNIYDIPGVKLLTRLRVNFSSMNEHRFRHNFDCLSPMCACGAAREDTEQYLLHCPQFNALRQSLC